MAEALKFLGNMPSTIIRMWWTLYLQIVLLSWVLVYVLANARMIYTSGRIILYHALYVSKRPFRSFWLLGFARRVRRRQKDSSSFCQVLSFSQNNMRFRLHFVYGFDMLALVPAEKRLHVQWKPLCSLECYIPEHTTYASYPYTVGSKRFWAGDTAVGDE